MRASDWGQGGGIGFTGDQAGLWALEAWDPRSLGGGVSDGQRCRGAWLKTRLKHQLWLRVQRVGVGAARGGSAQGS